MTLKLKRILCFLVIFTFILLPGIALPDKAYAESGDEPAIWLTKLITPATYDYLDEIYIEKYPEMGLRFKYGSETEKAELETLADQIVSGLSDESDMAKARATINWVRASIKYGDGSPFPYDTLRNRQGVCLNYALLASQLLRLEGIPSVVCDGYRADMETLSYNELNTKYRYQLGHAWLFAYIDDEWILFDPLWTKDLPVTDKEEIAKHYLIISIEGIVMTYPGMNYSYANSGQGVAYYNGIFKYIDNGSIDGDGYFYEENLGNYNFSVNGISQNFSMRIINSNNIQDGYSYLDDPDNAKRNAMVRGQVYYDGWLNDYSYRYENGVEASYTVMEYGGDKLLMGPGMKILADEYWLEGKNLAIKTGYSGYVLKSYPDRDPGEYTVTYAAYEDYGDDFTVNSDGYIEASKEGDYEVICRTTRNEDAALMGWSLFDISVRDEKPSVDYEIGSIDFDVECKVSLEQDTYMYTGEEIKPEVTVYERIYGLNGEYPTLKEGEDYTVIYDDDLTSIGWHNVTVKGAGIFEGIINTSYYVDHEHAWVEEREEPACESCGLVYRVCSICGEREVVSTIEPLGHSLIWNVVPAALNSDGCRERVCERCGTLFESYSISAPGQFRLSGKTFIYSGNPKKPAVTIMDTQGEEIDSSYYTLSYEKDCASIGIHRVTVRFKGNYKGSKTLKYRVKGSLEKAVTQVSAGSVSVKTYTGSAIKPAPVIKALGPDGTVVKLIKDTDYTLSYTNNKAVGTAKITIKGKGNYTGTKTVSFKIRPKATTLKSVSAISKGFTVKWTRQAVQTTGYQIQYSTSSTFKSGNKLLKVTDNGTVSKKITGLEAKKKYYVRIRTYKMMNGKAICSAWSSAKAVTTGG